MTEFSFLGEPSLYRNAIWEVRKNWEQAVNSWQKPFNPMQPSNPNLLN